MALDKKYIIQLRTIISKRGMSEAEKEDMILSTTEGRTASIRELKTTEAIALIAGLNGRPETNYDSDKKKRMKRQILAICHEMNWEHPDGKVDMKRVNGYCETRGYLKKKFDDYTERELPILVAQFKRMHNNYLRNENSTV